MINDHYISGMDKIKEGLIDWVEDRVRVVFVDTQIYNVDIANHCVLSSIPLSARIATSKTMTGKRIVFGAADADPVCFEYVIGPMVGAMVLYKDAGKDCDSDLIAYIGKSFGMPFLPNGGDVTITWDRGLRKIFTLDNSPIVMRAHA